MKILIVSDTHGRENNFLEAFEKEKPIDKIIHLGDLNGLEDYIENIKFLYFIFLFPSFLASLNLS